MSADNMDYIRLKRAAEAFIAEVGESEAVALLRRERDQLSQWNRELNQTLIERNEELRRLWDENEHRKTQIEILRNEIRRLGGEV